jgi:hypothetical protein
MLLFDTVIGLGNSDDNEDKFSQLPGPADPPAAAAQWAWLEAAMANSTAEYLWVGGHYPVWSACSHGPTQGLVQKLKPMLEKYGAHYMSGHDHCMVHKTHTLCIGGHVQREGDERGAGSARESACRERKRECVLMCHESMRLIYVTFLSYVRGEGVGGG